jgi:hypothetical protein
VLNEFYCVAFRKRRIVQSKNCKPTWEPWIHEYSEQRHQGRWCVGKTPMQIFLDAMPMAKMMMIAA